MHCAIAFEPGSAHSDLTTQRQLGEFWMMRIRLKAFESYRHLASPIFRRPLGEENMPIFLPLGARSFRRKVEHAAHRMLCTDNLR